MLFQVIGTYALVVYTLFASKTTVIYPAQISSSPKIEIIDSYWFDLQQVPLLRSQKLT